MNHEDKTVPLDDPDFIAFTTKRNESMMIKPTDNPHILEIKNHLGVEIVKITHDGLLFWNGREVTTDQEYRDAMMHIGRRLSGMILGEENESL